MDIIKQSHDADIFMVKDLTDDDVISLYNTCINYKAYVQELLKMRDHQLLSFAPGKSAVHVRNNLIMQIATCDKFLKAWDKLIYIADQDAKQN